MFVFFEVQIIKTKHQRLSSFASTCRQNANCQEREKKEKQGKAAAESASATLRVASQPAKGPRVLSWCVFTLDFEKLKVPKVHTCKAYAFAKSVNDGKIVDDAPYIVTASVKMGDTIKESFEAFHRDFETSPQYQKGGRGAKTVDVQREELNTQSQTYRAESKVLELLTKAEQDYLKCPWWFGYAPDQKASGPEYAYLGSIKWQLKGERDILFVGMASLVSWCEKTGAPVKLQRVVDAVSEADSDKMAQMIAGGVKMWHAFVSGEALVKVPWGILVYEQSLHNTVVAGIRWVHVADKPSDDLNALVNLLLPNDRAQIKAATPQALLSNIFDLINDFVVEESPAKRAKVEMSTGAGTSRASSSGSGSQAKAKAGPKVEAGK